MRVIWKRARRQQVTEGHIGLGRDFGFDGETDTQLQASEVSRDLTFICKKELLLTDCLRINYK